MLIITILLWTCLLFSQFGINDFASASKNGDQTEKDEYIKSLGSNAESMEQLGSAIKSNDAVAIFNAFWNVAESMSHHIQAITADSLLKGLASGEKPPSDHQTVLKEFKFVHLKLDKIESKLDN